MPCPGVIVLLTQNHDPECARASFGTFHAMPWLRQRLYPTMSSLHRGMVVSDVDLCTLCESVPTMAWTSSPKGNSQYLNGLGELYTGLNLAEGAKWDWFTLAHPDDVKRVQKEWKISIHDSSPFSSRYRVRRADGIYRWHEVKAQPVNDADGHLRNWLGTATDVDDVVLDQATTRSEQRQARETSAFLALVLQDVPVGIAFVDRNFRVQRINDELASFTLSTIEERTGQLVSEALPAVWPQIEPAFHHILKGGPALLNHEVTGPSSTDPHRTHEWRASYYPVRVDNEVVGIGAIVVDVTAQLDMENQRLLLATIVESSGDAIFGSDSMGAITSWNAAAELLFGVKAKKIIGKTLASILPPHQYADSKAVRERVIATGVPARIETMYFTRNGLPIEVQMSVSPLMDSRGHVIGVSRIARDVTEEHAAEMLLLESRRQLIETQRISHVGGVQYDVVHDIMTWSGELYKILGVQTDLAPSTALFLKSIHPDDIGFVREAWFNATLHGIPFDIDFRIVCPNGEERCAKARAEVQCNTKGTPITMVGTLSDETERVALEQERRGLELRFEAGFEQSAIGTAIVDLHGKPVRINQAVCDLLGRPKELLVGKSWAAYTPPGEIPLIDILEARVAAGDATYADERRYLRPDGSVVWAATHVSILRDEKGNPLYYFAHLLDITEYKKLANELAHRAMHDELTGLPNRALLTDRLSQSLARSSRSHKPINVMFLDIDNFKEINDSLGHSAGDELLIHVATQIRGAIRPGDTVARFGGDEFVIVCEGASAAEVSTIGSRVLEAIKKPVQLNAGEVRVSGSMGITASGPNSTPETMLQTADFAMYRAKSVGPNSIALYDEVLHVQAEERLATTTSLALALERKEFKVYYQPVVNIWTGELESAEALLRWEHPSGVLVNPIDFVSIAEHSGLIIPIGAWVLEEACEQLVRWQKTRPSMRVAVNLSVRQILNPDIIATVRDALIKSKVTPADLSLELTESIWMEDIEYCAKILTSFKDLGVGLVIDDFGTGYSSLSYLKIFPFDAVKIDRSFVDGLGRDSNDSALVAAIIAMSEALKLNVTAEGVETEEQLTLLKGLSCQRAQGYFLSKPMPADELSRMIDEGYRWPVNRDAHTLSDQGSTLP